MKSYFIIYSCLFLFDRTEKEKEFTLPCPIHSASLHPNGEIFVCGGQDFKMYKCCSETGRELGTFKCVFSFQYLHLRVVLKFLFLK